MSSSSALREALREKLLECIEKNPDTAAAELGEEIVYALTDLFHDLEGEKEDRQKWFREVLDSVEDFSAFSEIEK